MASTTRVRSDVENAVEGSVLRHSLFSLLVNVYICRSRSVGGLWKSVSTAGIYAAAQGICNPSQRRFIRIWNKIFVTSCVFAVLMDPLFFYILIIDQDKKCLQMDKKLMKAALTFRSLTDIIFTVHFIYQFVKARFTKPSRTKKIVPFISESQAGGNLVRCSTTRLFIEVLHEIAQKMYSRLSLSMIIDFLSLLPVPQLLIVLTFYKMKGSRYMEHKKILNIFLLGQYLPRIFRIHLSSKELKRSTGIWVKGLFNFFLYILASHVLGAFWYFFSIQRETSCWHSACVNHSLDPIGCMNNFYCHGHRATVSRNVTFLNEHCPLDTPDGATPPFNFGMFLDSLTNHNSEHIKFGKKFLHSFWWGLRNLSNLGTNLTTSTYVWENLFAILISIIGLLLFLYLIGNVQVFMQMEAAKSEEIRRKIRMKKLDVYSWISKNGLSDDMKKEIMNSIKKKLKENKDADLQNLFAILPGKTRMLLKRHLCMKILRTVPMLEKMNATVLEMICDHLKPVKYNENIFVFRRGDPLDCMLFIMDGTVWTYCSSTSDSTGQDEAAGTNSPSSMATKPLGKGQFYGEELLDWASPTFHKLPVLTQHVKSQTKVEGFVLMAKDLSSVVSKCQLQWDMNKCNNSQEVEVVAASTIKTAMLRFHNNQRALVSSSIPLRRPTRQLPATEHVNDSNQ